MKTYLIITLRHFINKDKSNKLTPIYFFNYCFILFIYLLNIFELQNKKSKALAILSLLILKLAP